MDLIQPPPELFAHVFPGDARQSWKQRGSDDRRLAVLDACGPYPEDPYRALRLKYLRAEKAAWETYLFTAHACGMFCGDKGTDLYSRLRGKDAANFRSAMSECAACWLLAARLRFPVAPVASGRNGRNLDLQCTINERNVGVEVKAPYRERATGVSFGDDSDLIMAAMDQANKQFRDDCPNLLVIVPRLRNQLFSRRRELLIAAFGQSRIVWDVDVRTGTGGPADLAFFPDGKFLNTQRPGGGSIKRDGLPAFRRISAVLVMEEEFIERYPFPNPLALLDDENRSEIWPYWKRQRDLHLDRENCVYVDHRALVLHNPYAHVSLAQEYFSEFPQLIPVGDIMKWTDGVDVDT